MFLTILCLLGFLGVAVHIERVGPVSSDEGAEGLSSGSFAGHKDIGPAPQGDDQGKNPDGLRLEERGKDSRRQAELAERLNVFRKYGAMAYVSLLLWPGEPSELRTGTIAARKILQSDHLLFSGAHGDGVHDGPFSSSAVRRSLDFKALEAISKAGAAGKGGGTEGHRSSLHRRPIEAPPPAFSSRRGLLGFPLAGEHEFFSVGKIGPDTENILHNGGLFVRAPQGEPIRSIFRGTVIFSEWLKEYGRVMIIDHGEHYCSLIAHADQLLKRVNDTVESGEVVATIGRTGAIKVPGLYFEIRHHGSPVDPLEWLEVGTTSKE
jgi:ABC-type multidrug transport system fused ATPase/permease subunit